MKNPIADALDTAIPAVVADERRPMSGFLQFAVESDQYLRLLNTAMSEYLDGPQTNMTVSSVLSKIVAMSVWLGFESGKLYAVSERVDNMLRMEDEWVRKQSESQ